MRTINHSTIFGLPNFVECHPVTSLGHEVTLLARTWDGMENSPTLKRLSRLPQNLIASLFPPPALHLEHDVSKYLVEIGTPSMRPILIHRMWTE